MNRGIRVFDEPLLFFLSPLAKAKRAALLEYGTLASYYVNDFRAKWRADSPAGREALLGSADIQSLADLTNSLDVVREMRVVPFGKETIVVVAITLALPLAPLVLTMVPLEELVRRLVGLLL